MIPNASSSRIKLAQHSHEKIDRLSLRSSRSRTFAKTSNEKGVYRVMPFTVLKRFTPYYHLETRDHNRTILA